MAKTYRVSATCYSTCGQIRQHLGLREFGGFARGIGEKNFETPFRGIARKLCLSFSWEYFENLLHSMTPHPLGEKALGKIETELWEQDEEGDRIIEVWDSLVRDVWFDYHPDRNPCEHGNYTSNTDGSVCVQCLQRIFDKHPDWDGHGANPINAESFWRAKSFVENLPNDVEKPELVPEPDGDVVMVWTKDGRHVCIVGIEPTGKLVISVARDRILWQSYPTKHIHLAEDRLHWPISAKYELYAWLQAAYRE